MQYTDHGIVALVRDNNNRFLLIEDKRDKVKNMWAPPHGVIETIDKTEAEGVAREVKEKCGINVTPLKEVITQPGDNTVKTVTFWLVDFKGDQEIIIDETKLSKYDWFKLDEILKLKLYPGTRIFFQKVKTGEIVLT